MYKNKNYNIIIQLSFEVYDVEESSSIKQAEKVQHMGDAICSLDDLLNSEDIYLSIPLTTNQN